jgi:hypothetical protein
MSAQASPAYSGSLHDRVVGYEPAAPSGSAPEKDFSLSFVGVAIVDGLEFDDWLAVGRRLLRLAEASAWWVGDWLVYGEWRYGERYQTVVDQLQLKYDRVRDYAYVAANVPPIIRRSDLTFTHHRIVAKLAPCEQRHWLERAAAEGWPTRVLANALRGPRLIEPAGRASPPEQLRLEVGLHQLDRWRAAADHASVAVTAWAVATLDEAAAALEGDR